ncbi:uncharacterized protein LOC126840881 [Adelges cooleyi]|uniref:uncharacterized protein LOC126840881 n=1 Tax=Adelges cooleyi TaxID=133065 RepID=UPI0021805ADB|nr:uncharacterized protein LOC126840881 [Adelges cooleyi]
MKSNMSLVLFVVCLFGLIIFGTCETNDKPPSSVQRLHRRLYDYNFGNFLTEEQLDNKEFLDSTYKKFVSTAQSAKQLLLENKIDEGRDYLIKSIRDYTVDIPGIHTQQVVQKFYGGNPDNAINLIRYVVEMFIADVMDYES